MNDGSITWKQQNQSIALFEDIINPDLLLIILSAEITFLIVILT